MKRFLPWLFIVLIGGYVVNRLVPPPANSPYDLDAFGKLPIQLQGRILPLDSAARNSLMLFAKRTDLKNRLPETGMIPGQPDGAEMTATQWLVELTMRPEYADTLRVFKIEFPEDLGFEQLNKVAKRYYSFKDLLPHFDELQERVSKIDTTRGKLPPVEDQLVKLWNNITRYAALSQSLTQAFHLDNLTSDYQELQKMPQIIEQEVAKHHEGKPADNELLDRIQENVRRYSAVAERAILRIIPTDRNEMHDVTWMNVGEALLATMQGRPLHSFVFSYGSLTEAYRADDPARFNTVVNEMRQSFIATYQDDITRVNVEYWFNQSAPFACAIVIYIVTFLLVCTSWLGGGEPFRRSAMWIALLAFLLHTGGILIRMYIHGRPPVTNLYSSAIFVGWGSIILCLILEKFWRNGIGLAAGSLIGMITLLIAHNLALLSGDTLEMVRAVLDSNFWLGTHVIVITLGYSAVFVAGFLACFFVIKGLLVKNFDTKQASALGSMVYGIICFGTLFSLVGTILGGIWADQSWGRFWGWDPKENGALLIVIWCAIILHARWGRLTGLRGIMALAIFGNVVTAWSWFGTNMLGVGLHSYGFMDAAFYYLMLFCSIQFLLIAAAMLPLRFWRSAFAKNEAPFKAAAPSI